MGFGSIFRQSWKDYKNNFKTIFWLMFVFYLIPFALLTFFQIYSGFDAGAGFSAGLIFWLIVLLGVMFFAGLFYSLGIMAASLFKKKFSFSESAGYAKKHYWRYFGFVILIFIYLAVLFLLLIIPGIIFSVFWAFAPYIFIYEKKGIHESLRESFRLVKKRWWKTFGYGILMILIVLAIGIVGGIVSGIFSFFLHGQGYTAVDALINAVVNFITLPLMILFFKNFYFEMKKSRKK